jgi:ADP-ribosylglycohydrolase
MDPIALARLSLDGLSVGDAFGVVFVEHYGFSFSRRSPPALADFTLPPSPWPWTDDTHMALSIVEVLRDFGEIEQDALARGFARRFVEEPYRGYGLGAIRLLGELSTGADWRQAAPSLFRGGSFGNGAAMRAAPIGAFFAGDPERASSEARKSAVITHAHPEGQAGAMAVAAMAALVAADTFPTGIDLLTAVLPFVPPGLTRDGVARAREIAADDLPEAVVRLGTGAEVTAQDTVPYCLWRAAHYAREYRTAIWNTAVGLGDVDTTCAIVGGVVALSSRHIPEDWIARREPLPGLSTARETERP